MEQDIVGSAKLIYSEGQTLLTGKAVLLTYESNKQNEESKKSKSRNNLDQNFENGHFFNDLKYENAENQILKDFHVSEIQKILLTNKFTSNKTAAILILNSLTK